MEIESYVSPYKPCCSGFPSLSEDETFISQVVFFNGEPEFSLQSYDLAIIGVEEDRNSPINKGSYLAPNLIRPWLYQLRSFDVEMKIVDLGNILGNTVNDKYCALEELLTFLADQKVTAIILGGSNEFFKIQIKSLVNYSTDGWLRCASIDALVDLGKDRDGLTSVNYLSDIINFSNVKIDLTLAGIQKYYMSAFQENYIAQNYLDLLRLKEIRDENVRLLEVPFRDSHAIGFDVSSLSSYSMPAYYKPRPNGLSSLDACQIGWYAGSSTELKSFGLYEINPNFDVNEQGSALGAQIIWHFILGYSNKSKFFSLKDVISFQKFNVYLDSYAVSIDFYNSPDGARWWMEVDDDGALAIVSCNKSDYYEALQGELPKKWWRYFQRSKDR